MALNTFTPPVAPSPGTNRKTKPKLLKADFGDGYAQTAADGVNWLKSTVTLTWDILLPTDATTIITFFRNQGGYTPFYYTLSDDSTANRWTCEEWSEERGQGGLRKVTATLTQYFGVLT
jgi:phage-related protein